MSPLAPGLLVAAPRSGSGKTTVTLGLQRAFRRRGVRVRGAKCGPDYIDPAFHAAATGEPSVNLDSFAMEPAILAALAGGAARGAGLVIAEGSMGLFDGIAGEPGRTGASADIAALFGWPVVLVLDVSGHAQSAGAVALGCARFDPRITIAGVVLNKVGSERHRHLAEAGLVQAGLPVFGALHRETADLEARLEALAARAERCLDLEAIAAAARPTRVRLPGPAATLHPPGQRVALAQDEAFTFVYPHLVESWRRAGAELVPFSPLADGTPPADCDACWLPGGYPELHAGRLGAAERFKAGLARFGESRPVHGECGGYMVLGQGLEDAEGRRHAMAGLLPVETSYARRKLHLGYRVAHLAADGILGNRGTSLVGHEFHYASVTGGAPTGDDALAEVSDGEGRPLGPAGHRIGLVSGSFFHLIAPRAR
jgi:cobyrinic acid a,c-diamide synthase